MSRVWKPLLALAAIAGAAFAMLYALGAIDLASRCGVSGTVTRGGKPMEWPAGGWLLVILIPENRDADPKLYSATTETATSSYLVRDVPAGRYVAAVQQFDTRNMDALRGRYDPGHTTLAVVVTHDGQVLDIDIPD